MTDEKRNRQSTAEASAPENSGARFVAYCDILGFSNLILSNYDRTREAYEAFGNMMSEKIVGDVQATIYSDAILVTSASLAKVLQAVQSIWFMALAHDLMIRGAIVHGDYWERRSGNNLLVVSRALVRAVQLERLGGPPAVVIADDVEIPDQYWLARFAQGLLVTPLLHFRDHNIVNPFNFMWLRSAANRANLLMEKYPEHKDKYLWFLALHATVRNNEILIPPDRFARYVKEGVLTMKPPITVEQNESSSGTK